MTNHPDRLSARVAAIVAEADIAAALREQE